MILTPDQDRVKSLLTETITLLCKNGLTFNSVFSIEALVGITLDNSHVILININETVSKGDGHLSFTTFAQKCTDVDNKLESRVNNLSNSLHNNEVQKNKTRKKQRTISSDANEKSDLPLLAATIDKLDNCVDIPACLDTVVDMVEKVLSEDESSNQSRSYDAQEFSKRHRDKSLRVSEVDDPPQATDDGNRYENEQTFVTKDVLRNGDGSRVRRKRSLTKMETSNANDMSSLAQSEHLKLERVPNSKHSEVSTVYIL